MSMIRCDQCSGLIDTDEHPETHEAESDQWICWRCRDKTEAYWRAEYNAASPEEKNPEKYRQDMIDAGRGHLLRDEPNAHVAEPFRSILNSVVKP